MVGEEEFDQISRVRELRGFLLYADSKKPKIKKLAKRERHKWHCIGKEVSRFSYLWMT
jgi:hypothetical protein